MRIRLSDAMTVVTAAAVVGVFSVGGRPAAAQTSTYEAPRTPDGNPDLNGIWQALGTAHWDIEGHAARPGPIVELGAIGAIPGGLGVVQGGEIPYQDWAEEQKQENFENWRSRTHRRSG